MWASRERRRPSRSLGAVESGRGGRTAERSVPSSSSRVHQVPLSLAAKHLGPTSRSHSLGARQLQEQEQRAEQQIRDRYPPSKVTPSIRRDALRSPFVADRAPEPPP